MPHTGRDAEERRGCLIYYYIAMVINPCFFPTHSSLFTVLSLQEVSLKLVLCLLVITGFPKIKSPGVMVKYSDYAMDEKDAVILKHYPDKQQCMLIDTSTRKKLTVGPLVYSLLSVMIFSPMFQLSNDWSD